MTPTPLRLPWAFLTRAPGYARYFLTRLYDIYLNHHKIIHYRNGFPVYSPSTPALFSRPLANLVARTALYGVLQNRRFPNLMSFAITADCPLTCEHCSFTSVRDSSAAAPPLTLAECTSVIAQAQDLGVSLISFTGGEPLTRPDLPDILRAVDKNLSATLMFTSGDGLAGRVRELRQAGLDSVYISIDSADAATHDTTRGRQGAHAAALAGLAAARDTGLTAGISACLFPDAVRTGKFTALVELAHEAGAHELLVFPAAPSGKLRDCAELMGDTAWIEELIAAAAKYRNDRRYPGVVIYSHIASHRALGCSGGARWLYVAPNGDISPCDFNHAVFGNIRTQPLWQIWETLSANELFQQSTWGGCKLRQSRFRTPEYANLVKP